MNKLLMFLIFSMFLISLVSADDCIRSEGCIGTFIQGTDVEIYQTCNNCTYCNFMDIRNKNNNSIIFNISASSKGTKFYYKINGYNTTTNGLGTYNYDYECGNNGEKETGTLYFLVTPSGNTGTANIVFFVFIILAIYTIALFGFFGRNIPITILGGMGLMYLSLYIHNNGIIIFRDTLTTYFGYITLGFGIIITFLALADQFDLLEF